MMLTGYPVEDLALRDSFVDASMATLEATAQQLGEAGLGHVAVVTGYLGLGRAGRPGSANRSARPRTRRRCCTAGQVAVTTAKHHLPNYGVFDEYRYFVPGNRLPVVRVPVPGGGDAVDVAIAICEDLWQDGGPVAVTRQAVAGLLVVPNASPYERGKDQARLELCVRRAREAGAALAYVNLMGGQDELVFDGDSIIVDAEGGLITRGPQFEEALLVADLDLPSARPVADGSPPADTPVEASDGTVMSIHRVALPARPALAHPGSPARRAAHLRPAGPPGRDLLRAGHRGAGLRAQERFRLSHPGPVRRDRLRAGRHDRRRRALGRARSTWCSCPAGTPRSIRWVTRRNWPSGRGCTPARSRSRPWSTRSRPNSACRAWPRRTSSPGSGA